jgi:hypothetical protein
MKGKQKELTNEELEHLAKIICRAGDEPETKSRALLILMDEVQRFGADEIAWKIKSIAFSQCGDEAVTAHIQLLRTEMFSGGAQ